MKRIKVYDVTDAQDLQKLIDMNKLSTKEGAVEAMKHLTVWDLYIAASSDPHFLDVLEKLGVEARKYFELQAEEVGITAMEAAKMHLDKKESA